MRRPWFYRMLLSYLPIFFFISSFLFFIFFQELSSQSKRDAVKANQVLNLLAMDKVENSLRAIDYAMVEFSLNNKVLNQFFQSKNPNDVLLNRGMLKEIDTFIRQNPLVDSIYLVRFHDRIVLTERYMFGVDEFSDAPYIRAVERTTDSMKWSPPHLYQEFSQSVPKKVVTLARSHFTPLGERCLIVANVKAESLRLLVEQTYSPNVTFVSVTGPEGSDILGNAENLKNSQILSENTSDYLNWTFRSGLVNGSLSEFAFQVSGLWMVLGATVVILGLFAIVYVTRRNYQPLENVVSHIQSLGGDKQAYSQPGTNEFLLIETAIEDLRKRSTIVEKRKEEEISLRKKHFLYEVIEGIRHISDEEWAAEMVKYNLPSNTRGASVLAIEIDNYAAFSRDFTKRDQFLFKYAIHNSVAEIIRNHDLPSWNEWISGKRLICIVLQSDFAVADRTRQACEEFLSWITSHLPLTVTVGLGNVAAHHDQIAESYQDAIQALSYKFFKGLGKVISVSETKFRHGAELFSYLQPIRALAHDFGIGNPSWNETFNRLFTDIRSDHLSSDDALSLLDYMVFQLDRAIGELASEYQKPWKEKGLTSLTEVRETAETLQDIQTCFYNILNEIGKSIGIAHEMSNHHQILLDVRKYIETNFTDPDMSLDRLKDQFELNPKYLSQLFKEKFGEGFMDFLIRLRIEYAKEMLNTTSEPIQSIAGMVGYLNVISFTRAFKKATSVSPGDYRKQTFQSKYKAKA